MLKKELLQSRDEWLRVRSTTIGGSDAACIVGKNPYKSNSALWKEKMGITVPEDISSKPVVLYGTNAEPLLRELFKLDFPEYEVGYEENNIWYNDKYPWAHVSLDGWIIDQNKDFGILEIKTSVINSAMQMEKWKNGIPDNYYIQVLHEMAVTEAKFAWVKAQLKHERVGDDGEKVLYCETKHYVIRRTDDGVEDDIKALMSAEAKFYECMKNNTEPVTILPGL